MSSRKSKAFVSKQHSHMKMWPISAAGLLVLIAIMLIGWFNQQSNIPAINPVECGPGQKPVFTTDVIEPSNQKAGIALVVNFVEGGDNETPLREQLTQMSQLFPVPAKLQYFPSHGNELSYKYYAGILGIYVSSLQKKFSREDLILKERDGSSHVLCWEQTSPLIKNIMANQNIVPRPEYESLRDYLSLASVVNDSNRGNWMSGFTPHTWDWKSGDPSCEVLDDADYAIKVGLTDMASLQKGIPAILKLAGCN